MSDRKDNATLDPVSGRTAPVRSVTGKTIEAARKAQAELCRKAGLPHFAPANGVCWSCRRQIYEVLDGTSFVTGCPYCHRSYCD